MERRLEMQGGGTLSLTEEGSYVRLEAGRVQDGRGLYKVWLLGKRGARMLAGTLAPEGGELRLQRRISMGQLEQAGCWPVEGAQAVLTFSFDKKKVWSCETKPGQLVADKLLSRLLQRPMLCRKTEAGFQLAVPFSPQRPVVLNTLLCLARVVQIEGRAHLVWTFDSSGRPQTGERPEGERTNGRDAANCTK